MVKNHKYKDFMKTNTEILNTGSLSPSVFNTLKNTYLLLGISLMFSVMTGFASHAMGITGMISGSLEMILFMVIQVGIIYMVSKNANNSSGLMWIMVFTGLEGFILDPIVSAGMAITPGAVTTTLAMTAAVTFAMSFTACVSKRNFSLMRGVLVSGLVIVIAGSVINLFVQSSSFSLALSGIGAIIFSFFILYDTQRIVRGEETNYINATLGLYLIIINFFISLLRLMAELLGAKN